MAESAEGGQGQTGAGEGGQGSFIDGITNEELRGNGLFDEFRAEGKTLDDFASAYVTLKGSVPVVPESVDGYTFEMPEGVQLNEKDFTAFKQKALESGLTADQFNAVVAYRLDEISNIKSALEQAKEKSISELKSDQKYGGDNFKPNLEKVGKLLAKFNAEALLTEDINELIDPEKAGGLLANKTAFFRFLVDVANEFSEDHLESGGQQGGDKIKRDEAGDPVLTFKGM